MAATKWPFAHSKAHPKLLRCHCPDLNSSNKLRVIAYTGGQNTPSRVPRLQQYVAPLSDLGVQITEFSSRAGLYPPDVKWKRPIWALQNLIEHVPAVIRSRKYDVTLFQRELFSTYLTLEPFTKGPRVLDVDDAIWVHRGGKFAYKLAKLCDHIICGNSFIADEFARHNPNVSVLPTAIDTNRFQPRTELDTDSLNICWLGLSSGFRFLLAIEPALNVVLRRNPQVKLQIVSNKPLTFRSLPHQQVEFVTYTRTSEIKYFQNAAIGIMPLDDSVVSRGKCSFKMLQFMSSGVPVVVSSYGMNVEVLAKGQCGFGASSINEWVDGMEMLLHNSELRKKMGKTGRQIVLEYYSLRVLVPQMAGILTKVAGLS